MPDLTIVVSGTGTEVGKTWFACRSLALLAERGHEVAARKPVQSFDPADATTDADLLAAATADEPERVCPRHRWYGAPLAPPMAARELQREPITLAELVSETHLPARGIALIEGVGGARSPLAADGDTVALARALQADQIVIVAGAGLGTINEVILTTEAFRGRPVVVALNRFEPTDRLHTMNAEWLRDEVGLEVVTSPLELADLLERLMMEDR